MYERILGKDLRVSAVGLGCMGFSHAYGAPTEKGEAVRTLRDSLELGYTFFDTAECYGPYENEELVGEAFAHCRDTVVIATKFGVTHAPDRSLLLDSRPETIRKSVEGSLKRLKTDRIDLYYQHRIDPKVSPEEVAGTMSDLIQEGKIAHWGISEANEEYLRRAHAVCPVTAIQNRYSMMYRGFEKLFPVLEELEIGFVAFSPLANGLLSEQYDKYSKFESGDYRADMPQYQPQAFDENAELFRLLALIAAQKKAAPAQIALAWMLCKKPYIVPIPGSRRIHRLYENAKAADILLSEREVSELDRALNVVGMSEVFGGHTAK